MSHKILVELEPDVEAKLREIYEGTDWTLPKVCSHIVNCHVKNWILADQQAEAEAMK